MRFRPLGGRVAAAALTLLSGLGAIVADATPAFAEVVSRDPFFAGGAGFAMYDWDLAMDQTSDVIVQPDGKILVSGWASVFGDDDGEVIRLDASGSPDESFGTAGEYYYDGGWEGGTSNDRFEAMALQPDGKIVVVGSGGDGNGFAGGLIVRLNADGTEDVTFDGDGFRLVDGRARDLVLTSDGGIVVIGYKSVSSANQADLWIAKFDSTGQPVAAFGAANGETLVDTGSSGGTPWWDTGSRVAETTDGAFVVSASRSTSSSDGSAPMYSMVARFTSAGLLDAGFNGTGYRLFDFAAGGIYESADFVVADSAGKAVVAATVDRSTVLVRVTPTGALDGTFGSGGRVNVDEIPKALARDNSGRLLLAAVGAQARLRRFSANGALDSTFNKGLYTSDFSDLNEFPAAIAVQPDGKIVHVGFSFVDTSDPSAYDADWYVERVRFSPDPPPAGYWMLESNGAIWSFGDAPPFVYGHVWPFNAADFEPTPDGAGGWRVTSDGIVERFGTAKHFGDRPALAPGESVTSMSGTKAGDGYWLFTDRGRVIAYGKAVHRGDMSAIPLNGPVLESVRTASGLGYYMVASDGGIFSFGDAKFHGSMGGRPLNGPVVGLAPDPDNVGYWLVGSDGGVFSFNAGFRGSMGGIPLNKPVIGMVAYGNGYLMVGEDGGIFSFSDKPFVGSLGGNPPRNPIVAVAAYPK